MQALNNPNAMRPELPVSMLDVKNYVACSHFTLSFFRLRGVLMLKKLKRSSIQIDICFTTAAGFALSLQAPPCK
jgi:hypothetical protein